MGGLLGGLTSSLFGSGGASDNQAALDAVKNVPLPILKEYYPELYKQVVSLNPQLESAVNLGPSQMQGISTDPALRQAQMNALSRLQSVGQAGGRDAQFMSDTNRVQNDVNSNLQGQEGAIEQNMATRGLSGGGSELVARQMAAQQAANRQSSAALDINAQAQQRALQALMSGGQLGGQMEAQDFGQQAQKAQAADQISRFNASNQQQVQHSNVGNQNQAQQYNANLAQNTSNQNTSLGNSAQQYNLGLAQQNYNNQVAKASGIANQYNNIAKAKNAERDSDRQLTGDIIGAGFSAYGASSGAPPAGAAPSSASAGSSYKNYGNIA